MFPLLLLKVTAQKCHLYFLNNYIHLRLAKFEQNRMMRITQNLELFAKKPFTVLTISDISLAPF